MRTHLLTLARYHVWATQRLSEHIARLSENDYRRDVGLFSKSVHGTLNHLLVGEHLLWYRRFTEGNSPAAELNEEIEMDRATLAKRQAAAAAAWTSMIEGLSDKRLNGALTYSTSRGKNVSMPFVPALIHVFKHATHHRGQIAAALSIMGESSPDLDLIDFLQKEAQ